MEACSHPAALLNSLLHHPHAGMLKSKVQQGMTQLYSAVQEATCPQPSEPQPQTYAPPAVLQNTAPQQQQQPVPLPPPPHYIIQCLCHHVTPIPGPSFGGFMHPGTLMGPGELNLLRQRVAGSVPMPPPFQAALASLKANTPAQYTPHALRDVLVEWYDGPKIGAHLLPGNQIKTDSLQGTCRHG